MNWTAITALLIANVLAWLEVRQARIQVDAANDRASDRLDEAKRSREAVERLREVLHETRQELAAEKRLHRKRYARQQRTVAKPSGHDVHASLTHEPLSATPDIPE